MDEQRVQAYLSLIEKLLECPGGEELQILNGHLELVDEGFVQVCELVAAQLQEEGQDNNAGFLRNVAQQVGAFLARRGTGEMSKRQQQFGRQLLQAENEGGTTAVHQVMRQNMRLIVPALGDVIAQFVQGLLTQNPDQAEPLAALVEDTCNSIQRFPYGQYAEALEIAIRGYGVVLELRADNPPKRAQTLTNLGNAHSTQAQMGMEPGATLERAITAYNEAAEIMRRFDLAKYLSATLTNLGSNRLIQAWMGIAPTTNLERAIAAYDEAEAIRRRLGLDKDLSQTLTGLGDARSTQAEMGINPAANFERAISAYEEAVSIRRRLGLTQDLSATLNNLGIARRFQAEMGIDPTTNLEQAISACNESAGIRRRLGLDKDLAQTLTNLGVAHFTQAEMGLDPAANLEQAIAACNESAGIRRRLGLDKDLSTTLTNLGNAHWRQSKMGLNSWANLEQAIAAYNEAVGILRQLGLDKDLAGILTNLGNTHLTQAEMGINPIANLKKAIAAYDEAAEIRRRLGLARDLAQTLNNFGFAYQTQSRLDGNSSTQKQEALENASGSFQDALEQVEYLRGEIGTDSEGYKRNFNEEWNRVYQGMVEVCLELGRYQDAIEYVDRSKARNLVELMATRDAYPGGVIPENIRQRLQALKTAITQEDRRLQKKENPDYTHLNQLRQEKQELEPYKPLHFQVMQALLDEETAILEWYILPDKFLTFTLTNQTLNLWTSSKEDLDKLIDWTNTYINDYRRNNSQWRDSLPQRLETLAQILHLNEILANLRQNFPNCQKLILIPHRYLHLFPLHALPVTTEDGESKFLQDLFPKGVGYAPNCQVLQQAQNRSRPDFNRLFAIQNPTQDLQFTDMEVEAIQSLFNPHQVLKHDQAEKVAIDKETLKNDHCIHFSCHGYFNFEDALKSALILAKSEFTPPPPTDDPSRYLPLEDDKLLDLEKCLTLEDILRLDLTNCRLVTLSACETGITDITSTSDEYIGLPSGFILAGSPNVVSTLWAVADISTAIFMIQFYQTLQQQPELSVVLALRQTQTWLRSATVQDLLDWVDGCAVISPERRKQMKRGLAFGNWKKKLDAKRFESPYYWAAFCAIGA
ncbi:CHAT domain-containing protein [Limnospira platensis CENA597]|uniref:CHAT domain-containing protein n=1 Tax=Limnospira platensis TaxID=118562 RepID=UPI003DA0ACA5